MLTPEEQAGLVAVIAKDPLTALSDLAELFEQAALQPVPGHVKEQFKDLAEYLIQKHRQIETISIMMKRAWAGV